MLSFSFSFFLSVHPSFVGSLVLYVWRIELNEMNAAVLTDERFMRRMLCLQGGAIYIADGGHLAATWCTFENNQAASI